MNILVVFDHPRRNSLTGAVLDKFVEGLESAGHKVEVADLCAENFDPRMQIEDEPIWKDRTQVFSQTIVKEQQRADRNDGIVLLFPVWWWSCPAMTKGWIDRVFNQGWAHGWAKLKHRKGLIIGVAADSAESFRKREYDSAITTQLLRGVMKYCGIDNSSIELLHDSLGNVEERENLLTRARKLGADF
jgi:NAD(P)H dehydrogenase (quinone)